MIERTKTVYIANDGSEYTDKEKCMKHDTEQMQKNEAENLFRQLNIKPVKRVKHTVAPEKYSAQESLWNLFFYGNEAVEAFLWRPQYAQEIETFIRWWELEAGNGRPLKRSELNSPETAKWLTYSDEIRIGETYIVGIEDDEYILVINRNQSLNAIAKMFDVLENRTAETAEVTVHVTVMNSADRSIKKYAVKMPADWNDRMIEEWLICRKGYSCDTCSFMSTEGEVSIE